MKAGRMFYVCLDCEIAVLHPSGLLQDGACVNCGDNNFVEATVSSDAVMLGPRAVRMLEAADRADETAGD